MIQYYASFNPGTPEPQPVACWYDTQTSPGIDYTKPGFLLLTAEQWSNRNTDAFAVQGGALVLYRPAPFVVPLKTQATTLLKTQQFYVMQNYAIYGEDTPPDWLVYLKALRSIANGTDTTSTVLPTTPTS